MASRPSTKLRTTRPRRSAATLAAVPGASVPPTARGREESAYELVSRILLEGRLRPGTPLRERQLAEVLGLTRGAVRKLLIRLGQEGKLQMLPNRGAFVPQPSGSDIRQVYGARKAVEAGLIALLASGITAQQLARLRAHMSEERRAQRQGRRDESVRLAGAFHLELAQALGNPELSGIIQRLVSKTQMFVALFEPAGDSGCGSEEHQKIVDALAAGDGDGARSAMLAHLQHVEDRVTEHVREKERPPLVDILRLALRDREANR